MAKKAAATGDIITDGTSSDFIFLIRHTQKGLDALAELPNRVQATVRFVADTLKARCGFVPTTGCHDVVSFFSGTDEQAYQFSLYLRSLGTVEVEMLKVQANTAQQYSQIVRAIRAAR
jgi:uncharacterized protein with GYD domain